MEGEIAILLRGKEGLESKATVQSRPRLSPRHRKGERGVLLQFTKKAWNCRARGEGSGGGKQAFRL